MKSLEKPLDPEKNTKQNRLDSPEAAQHSITKLDHKMSLTSFGMAAKTPNIHPDHLIPHHYIQPKQIWKLSWHKNHLIWWTFSPKPRGKHESIDTPLMAIFGKQQGNTTMFNREDISKCYQFIDNRWVKFRNTQRDFGWLHIIFPITSCHEKACNPKRAWNPADPALHSIRPKDTPWTLKEWPFSSDQNMLLPGSLKHGGR